MSDRSAPFPVPAGAVRLLLSTAPPDAAQGIARILVEEGLAACVSLVPGLRSVYRWQGGVQDDPETLLLLKTTADQAPALARRLEALHPYEVPEILALEPTGASAPYLAWLLEAASPPPTGDAVGA